MIENELVFHLYRYSDTSDIPSAEFVANSFGLYPPAFYMPGAFVALSGVEVLLVLFVKQDHQDPGEAARRGTIGAGKMYSCLTSAAKDFFS